MKKRLLSALLVFCMLAGFFPPQAMAADEISPFTDVKSGDWYYEGVEYVRQNGLMNGVSEKLFSPNEQMSRAMTATVLHRLAASPAPAAAADFSDVPEGQWYSQAIAWAAEQQIVSGYGDGLFGVNDPITRQQLAAILHRYARQINRADLEKTADLSVFSDRNQIGEYALEPMQWAVAAGLLTGVSPTSLEPNGLATRGQIATILARFCKEEKSSRQFTITFDLNYGESPVYQTQKVENGKSAVKPADPTRSGYAFAGWHAKKEGGSPYDFTSPVTGDLTLYALWTQAASGGLGGGGGFGGGGGSGSGSGSGSQSPYLYSITGVSAADGKAQITVNTDKPCTLRVRVLDDEGKTTLDTAAIPAGAQLELETLQVPLNHALPDYFRLEAALLDENGKELCEKFLCVNYTSAYAAFDAATVDDFDGQIVLNFDEQPDENFGVLPQGAIQAQAAPAGRAGGNTVVLDNADHRLDETKTGDIIAVYNAQGEVVDLIKVRAITLSEGQALVEPDPDAALEDFYDLLKVDITIDADESMVDMSEADEGVTLLPSEEEQQGRATITNTIKMAVDRDIGEFFHFNLEGTYSSSVTLELEWEPHLFQDSYLYFNQTSTSDWEYTGKISAKISNNDSDKDEDDKKKPKKETTELNLGSLELKTGIPGVKSEIVLALPLSLELEGSVEVSETIHDERTFSYSSESGTHSGSKQESTNTLDFAAKLTFEIGFKVSLSCKVWNDLVKASCSFCLGIEVSGEISKNLTQKPAADAIHTCAVCIDGNATTKMSVDMSLSAKPVKTTYTLASYTIAITLSSQDFYFSHQNDLDSPLGGKPSFGWGQCPNQKYRTEFTVQNSEGQNVPDAQLTVSKGGQQIPDAAPGKAVYLYNGDYTAAAQADGQQGSKDFKVNDEAQTVTVQLVKGADEPDNPPSGKLATPTNLTWGKRYNENLPGAAQWNSIPYTNRYQIKIYKVGVEKEIFRTTYRWKDSTSRENFYSYSAHVVDLEKNGNGNYYFTIQALGDGERILDSDIAQSENWTYVAPNKQLLLPVAPQLNVEQTKFIWEKTSDESEILEYNLEIWSSTSPDGVEKSRLSTVSGVGKDGYSMNHLFTIEKFDKEEEKYYFFRVKAIPKDMTQYRSSEWSEFSEPYHYIPEP